MPQVAARINDDQERWLKDYFRTKSAGAEFILPWAVDTFFRAITSIKHMFSAARLSYLLLRVTDACDVNNVHLRHGVSKSSLESKLKGLDDTQATALMVWASAFWVSRNCSAENMDEYIRAY